MSPRAIAIAIAAVALAASGCGASSSGGRPRAAAALGGACTARGLARVAAASAVRLDAISTRRFVETDGSAACRFVAPRSSGGPLALTVDVSGAPQAYNHLERKVEEYSQGVIWFHEGEHAYPRPVAGLGLDADWLPAEREVVTTDGVNIVNVTVSSCPHRDGSGEALATAVAHRYLGPLRQPHF
jgi:hypothetical protein